MRKTLLAATALLTMTAGAWAATITFTAQEDGGLVQTVATPDAAASIGPALTPSGDFSILMTGSTNGTGGSLPPFLLQGNTIDVQELSTGGLDRGPHTLDLSVLGIGLTSPTGLTALLSGFDATGLTGGWTATISTDINGTIIDSAMFTGPISGGNDVAFGAFNLPSIFDASVDFHIVTNGTGEANLGGALSAAPVPGPILGAGLPGLIAACFTMLGLREHRRRRKLIAVA